MQGLGGADLALEAPVEIARRVVAEMPGAIVKHGLRMNDQAIERHRVDEGLQGRARGAHRAHHVDHAVTLGCGKIGVADIGDDLARAIVDDQGGERRLRIERGGLAGEQCLDLTLQHPVDRRMLHRHEGLGRAQRPRQMRGVKRQRPAMAGDWLGAGNRPAVRL